VSERMTPDEMRDFLLTGTRTGKVATIGRGGAPHVVPIWFVLDGDDVIFTTGSTSAKARHLQRDPRVALTVDDDRPPYSFVQVRGRAELSDDLDDLLVWATRIGARYMGKERGEEFGRRNAVPGEVLVRIRPDEVVALRNIAD
jgi:PPOX class probable F420-dependent enzyme